LRLRGKCTSIASIFSAVLHALVLGGTGVCGIGVSWMWHAIWAYEKLTINDPVTRSKGGDMATLNLREVEKRLGKSSIAITISDANAPDMPIIFANDAFITLNQYDKAEIIGHNCRFLQGDFDNVVARGIIGEALETGTAAQATL
jgi:hypothetical protein